MTEYGNMSDDDDALAMSMRSKLRISLLQAVQNDRVQEVRELAEKGANVNSSRSSDGATPLIYAANSGHCDVIRVLCELGADVNKSLFDGATAMFVAARNGNVKVIRVLHELGADINYSACDGATPLFVASQQGKTAAIRLLFELGADINLHKNSGVTPALIAAYAGHVSVIRVLSELGADMNRYDIQGITPLFEAARLGHLNCVYELCQLSSDVNCCATTRDGSTPLSVAASKGYMKIVQKLIESGANVNALTNKGETPVFLAARHGHVHVIRLLCDLKADVDMSRSDGVSPMLVASHEGMKEVVQELLGSGAKIDRSLFALGDPQVVCYVNDEVAELCMYAGGPAERDFHGVYDETTLLLVSTTKLLFKNAKELSLTSNVNAASHFSIVDTKRFESFLAQSVRKAMLCGVAARCLFLAGFVLRRKVTRFAWILCQSSFAHADSSNVNEKLMIRRYVEIACFLMDPEMLVDVLSLRLTCHSNNDRGRFPIFLPGGPRYVELEYNVIEEWLGCSSSRLVSTGSIVSAIELHASEKSGKNAGEHVVDVSMHSMQLT